MGAQTVKGKLVICCNFLKRVPARGTWILPCLALLTFISSLFGIFPTSLVETWYARWVFPQISGAFAPVVNAVPFSWLDVVIVAGIAAATLAVFRRKLGLVISIVAFGYLFFFWSWGLNYHRARLDTKLPLDDRSVREQRIEEFAGRAVREINTLYTETASRDFNETALRDEAVRRVRRVIGVVDGLDWEAPHRIKVSLLVNPWFRVAGIDGLFSPFSHEPIINNGLLAVERPFVIAHELAHVRGYPDEGDANFIALLATLMSENPHLRYSGWLHLWLYLRDPKLDRLLDDGPRRDLQRIFERVRSQQIRWVSIFQAAILDWYLKANDVDEGIRSYSRVVLLAIRTEESWERFR